MAKGISAHRTGTVEVEEHDALGVGLVLDLDALVDEVVILQRAVGLEGDVRARHQKRYHRRIDLQRLDHAREALDRVRLQHQLLAVADEGLSDLVEAVDGLGGERQNERLVVNRLERCQSQVELGHRRKTGGGEQGVQLFDGNVCDIASRSFLRVDAAQRQLLESRQHLDERATQELVEDGEVLGVRVEHADGTLDAANFGLLPVDAGLGTGVGHAAHLVGLDHRGGLGLALQEGELEVLEHPLDELVVVDVDIDQIARVLATLATLAATALAITAGTPTRLLASVDGHLDLALVAEDRVVLDDVLDLVLVQLATDAVLEPVLVRLGAVTTRSVRHIDALTEQEFVGVQGKRTQLSAVRIDDADGAGLNGAGCTKLANRLLAGFTGLLCSHDLTSYKPYSGVRRTMACQARVEKERGGNTGAKTLRSWLFLCCPTS